MNARTEQGEPQNGTPGPWKAKHEIVISDDFCAGSVATVHDYRTADARLICAAVNEVRAAMPDLTDEQRIERLEAGALTSMAETLANLIQAAEMYADMAGEDFKATYARAALEAIDR